MPDCIVVREAIGPVRVVHFFGDFRIAAVQGLAGALRDIEEGQLLVIELSHCRLIDTAGLRVLVNLFQTYGGRLRLVVPPAGAVERAVRAKGLAELLPITDSLHQALRDEGRVSKPGAGLACSPNAETRDLAFWARKALRADRLS